MSEQRSPSKFQVFKTTNPFRRAVLRGMAILLPPLLTIVIFVWIGRTLSEYMLVPLEDVTFKVIYSFTSDDIRTGLKIDSPSSGTALYDGVVYKQAGDGKFVPLDVYNEVLENPGGEQMPGTAPAIYQRYVKIKYLQRRIVIPVFVCGLVLICYILGKFIAAGAGAIFWNLFEKLVHRLPLIRNVYSSVKQVTDLMFSERELSFNRVVAVEYPRRGAWALAFVVGDGMLDLEAACNEPVLTVLVPTSPAPFSGFAVVVRKSEVIDMNMTLDQALQFIISCGVVIPPQQVTQGVLQANAALAATNGVSPEIKPIST